MNVSVNFQL